MKDQDHFGLKVRMRNSILDFTGSQYKEAKTGELWSLFHVPFCTQVAAF